MKHEKETNLQWNHVTIIFYAPNEVIIQLENVFFKNYNSTLILNS